MLRPSPNHGTQRLPNDDDEMMIYKLDVGYISGNIYVFLHPWSIIYYWVIICWFLNRQITANSDSFYPHNKSGLNWFFLKKNTWNRLGQAKAYNIITIVYTMELTWGSNCRYYFIATWTFRRDHEENGAQQQRRQELFTERRNLCNSICHVVRPRVPLYFKS